MAGKAEGNRTLGRPTHKYEDNIEMDFRQDEVVWTGLIWAEIGTSGRVL
jgi:hypothetical protein